MKYFPLICRRILPLGLCLAGASLSPGAVTYVDPPDIDIPNTFGGVYLDLQTSDGNLSIGGPGAPVSGPESYTLSFTEPASGVWDVNFFFGGIGVYHNSTFQPYRGDAADPFSAVHNLGINTEINGGPALPQPTVGSSNPLLNSVIGGSGASLGGGGGIQTSGIHVGAGDNQFASGIPGYIAFVLPDDPNTIPIEDPLYGWMQVTLKNDGTAGTIDRWAYSPDPIMVGWIPEPGSAMLLLIGACGLVIRRKR